MLLKVHRMRWPQRRLANSMRQVWRLLFLLLLFIAGGTAQAQSWTHDSNLKFRAITTSYPADSVLRETFGSSNTDLALTFRHNVRYRNGKWSAELSYDAAAQHSDALASGVFPGIGIGQTSIPDDETRLFDLSDSISSGDDYAVSHRIDRLAVAYQSADNVIKIGRQAISWGNGLVFNPMDFFNPFDPAAIDTEYKTGDDMLYAQHLFASGNDVQVVWVGRRRNGEVAGDSDSVAVKYHGFIGANEIDLLLAEHFDDKIFAVGGVMGVGGAVLRGDWVYTDTEERDVSSLVTSLSYSWTSFGKNVSGILEYFHNGFGVNERDYPSLLAPSDNALQQRLGRGELFTIGKNYLAGSATVEINPLWLLTPTAFHNIGDGSTFVQFVSQHDLRQNLQLVAALRLPLGVEGSEFGGLRVSVPGSPLGAPNEARLLSSDWTLYGQLAWYF